MNMDRDIFNLTETDILSGEGHDTTNKTVTGIYLSLKKS